MIALSYPFRIGAHGRVADTTDTKRIWTDRVRAVVSTEVGDRVMRPTFGVDSTSAILSIGTPAQSDIPGKIADAFKTFLPTITLESINTSVDEDSHSLIVEVVFTCPDNTIASTSVTLDGGLVTSETDPTEVLPL